MAKLEIHRVPVLRDNYVWLAHEASSNLTAAVDPAVVDPVLAALDVQGWSLTHILNTHHHHDHTGGNLEFKEKTGCTIVVSALALQGSARLPAAIMGDGNFLMGASALWTAAHYVIPLLLIVNNNRSYGNDVGHQKTMA